MKSTPDNGRAAKLFLTSQPSRDAFADETAGKH